MVARGPGRRSPALACWRLLACLLPAALGCESEAPLLGKSETSVQSIGPVLHNAFGMPGPWWQAQAEPQAFDADLSQCRRESSQAREQPGQPDPLDAAYRAFLGCMEANGWRRGVPPAPGAE
jgi:hypothetical protein